MKSITAFFNAPLLSLGFWRVFHRCREFDICYCTVCCLFTSYSVTRLNQKVSLYIWHFQNEIGEFNATAYECPETDGFLQPCKASSLLIIASSTRLMPYQVLIPITSWAWLLLQAFFNILNNNILMIYPLKIVHFFSNMSWSSG